MADIATRYDMVSFSAQKINWGAIWAGVFTFVAIWSVFGMLGEAIFVSAANASTAGAGTGISIGMAIWAIVLTIIAMYVGGRVTAHFVNFADRMGRIMHGMAMFGLSVFAVVLLLILSGGAMTNGGTSGAVVPTHGSYMLTVFSDLSWVGFASLFLGWLGALGGASHRSSVQRVESTSVAHDLRPAA